MGAWLLHGPEGCAVVSFNKYLICYLPVQATRDALTADYKAWLTAATLQDVSAREGLVLGAACAREGGFTWLEHSLNLTRADYFLTVGLG